MACTLTAKKPSSQSIGSKFLEYSLKSTFENFEFTFSVEVLQGDRGVRQARLFDLHGKAVDRSDAAIHVPAAESIKPRSQVLQLLLVARKIQWEGSVNRL